jgi:predicted RNase H-like HicB family nuclease
MQIPVLVEPIAGNGYRARGIEPFGFSAEGTTRAEALAKLKEQVQARVSAGAEIVTLEVGPQPHPWLEFAGMYKDDPDFKEVLDIMAENRRQLDADPDIP